MNRPLIATEMMDDSQHHDDHHGQFRLHPNIALLIAAIAYPPVSFCLLWAVTAPTRIPQPQHLVAFSLILPAISSMGAVWLRVVSAKCSSIAVVAFVIWMVLIGWGYHVFIGQLWASI